VRIEGVGDGFWLHALEIGAGAELLAIELGWPCELEAYAAGLLHDLGCVELGRTHGTRYGAMLEEAPRTAGGLVALERAELGKDHSTRLARSVRAGGLPGALCNALGSHHAPEGASPDAQAIAGLIQAAHELVHRDGANGWSDRGADPGVGADLLGLEAPALADLRRRLTDRVKELSRVFGS